MPGAIAAINIAAILLATTLAVDAFAQTPAETYAWPLDLPRELTSSFAEYRPGRYHMGIDLRTGPIGKDVYAAADGYVSRLRCSPYGYGKAVYVQFNDGNSAVYAHLDDFAPALRDYVRAAQHEREQYTVDLTVPAGKFPVKRGERIAKSGQTGIGVPHLHYELRDPAGVPINPRLLGVTWPDTTPPEIRAVALTPIEAKSSVNGDVRTVVIPVKKVAPGQYEAPEVRVGASFGFAIETIDPTESGARLGVYRVRVSNGADEIFRLEHDRVSYDHGEDGAVAYHPALMDQGRFLTLWRWPGNDSEIYAVSSRAGAFALGERDRARIDIVVEDFSGNASLLTIPLRNDDAELPAPPPRTPRPTGSVSYESTGIALVATAAFNGDESEPPTLVANDNVRFPFRRIGRKTFRVAYHSVAPVSDVQLHIEHPGMTATPERFVFLTRGAPAQTITFGDAIVRTQPNSPYGALELRVTPVEAVKDPELIAQGAAYEIFPAYMPVDAPMTISLPISAGVTELTRAHIYRRDKDKWTRIDTKRPEGRAEAEVKQLGVYAVLEDATAPTLEILQPSPGVAIDSARPIVRVRATDLGSGIDTFRANYNGKWILLAYDPEQDLLEWEQDEDLPAGPGTLAIEVRDYAGNVSRREISLTIPAP